MDQVWRLKHFLAAAELGSLQAAARHLNISQPALSKSLKELETHLNSALFERSSRGVVLTAAGRALRARACDIQAAWDSALIELTATRDGARGELRIGVGPTYEAAFMGKVLARLGRDFPNLRLSVRTGVGAILLPALNAGEIGLYIGGLRSGPETLAPGINEIHLYDQTNRIVAAAGDPLARATPPGPEALAARAWVRLSYDTAAAERTQALFRKAGVAAPRSTVQTDSLALALDLVRDHGFLTSLPEPLLHPALGGGLVALEVPDYAWQIATGISYRQSIGTSAPFHALLAVLRAEVAALGLGPAAPPGPLDQPPLA